MTHNTRKKRLNPLVAAAIIVAVFIFTLIIKKQETTDISQHTVTAPIKQTPVINKPPLTEIHISRQVIVKEGDTLHSIFAELGIPQQDFWNLINTKGNTIKLLKPKQHLEFTLNKEYELQKLRIFMKKNRVLSFTRKDNQFIKKISTLPIRTITSFKSGEITTSFEEAAKKAGLPSSIYQKMLKIFSGKINFSRDLHKGDTFYVVYNEEQVEGKAAVPTHIAATEIDIKNTAYQAVYFEYPPHHSGYYTPKGKGIEPRFLAFPLKFKRISSGFSHHRLDPILHKVQAHLGIDLAAPRGTPIHSIGNGRIIFIGKSRGYGNMIKIRYDRHFTALYAHMRNFAKHLKLHQYVHKNQVIGYVGSTGWATGPHLHFGIYINGVAHDWLKLDHPTTAAVPKKYQQRFKQQAKQELEILESYKASI